MKKPSGKDLLALLVSLYADQNGVNITYEVIERKKEKNEERTF